MRRQRLSTLRLSRRRSRAWLVPALQRRLTKTNNLLIADSGSCGDENAIGLARLSSWQLIPSAAPVTRRAA